LNEIKNSHLSFYKQMVLTHVEHTLRNKQYYKKVFRTYYQAYKKILYETFSREKS